MKFLGVRLRETLGFELVLSILCAMLFRFNVLVSTVRICFLVMVLCGVANIIRLIWDLRGYRRYSGVRRSVFYKTNFLVVLIVAVLPCTFATFNIEPLFTWLFFPFKFLYILGMPKIVSALALNAAFAVVTACVPFVVKPKFRKRRRNKK